MGLACCCAEQQHNLTAEHGGLRPRDELLSGVLGSDDLIVQDAAVVADLDRPNSDRLTRQIEESRFFEEDVSQVESPRTEPSLKETIVPKKIVLPASTADNQYTKEEAVFPKTFVASSETSKLEDTETNEKDKIVNQSEKSSKTFPAPEKQLSTPFTGVKKQWPYQEIKLPAYAAGGPASAPSSKPDDKDCFTPPDIGHACYLTYCPARSGSLKLQYAKATEEVSDRIIGAGTFSEFVQLFKYKNPVVVATEIFAKSDGYFRGIGAFLRAAKQHNASVTFYPLPPNFPPFAVVYNFSDETVKVQYAGEGSVNLTEDCTVAVAADPRAIKTVQTASKMKYHVFKLQFINTSSSCMVDFAQDLA